MMPKTPGFSQTFDLATLGDEDHDVLLRPSVGECAAVADWLGVSAVEALEAEITLSRKDSNRFRYEARFAAEAVQACVVTLQPVHAHLEGAFHRIYELSPRFRRPPSRETTGGAISLSGDEEPETIETTLIDLAAPVLEELSLALDPYPRAPGVVFEPPSEPQTASDRPFAVLETLKSKLGAEEQQAAAAPEPQRPKRRDR